MRVKKYKLNSWEKSKLTKRTVYLASTFGLGTTGPAKGAKRGTNRRPQPSTVRTFAGGLKKILGSCLKMLLRFVTGVISILVRTLRSIISFKWLGWVKTRLTRLYSRLTSTRKKTAKPKLSIGSRDSWKISAYSYLALIVLCGSFIYYARSWWAIVICLFATELITRRFK